MLEVSLDALVKSFVAILAIMDPFASLPTFLMITRKYTPQQRRSAAILATGTAGAVLVLFTFAGPELMTMLGITMPAFQIAGGILLLVTALQVFLGIELESPNAKKAIGVAVVVVAVPLLTGPGVMTAAVILAGEYGLFTVFAASTGVVLVTLAVLLSGNFVYRYVGEHGLAVFSKVMAIFLAAIAIEFILTGLGQSALGMGLVRLGTG
ncbi:MAG: MarC family protein [Candidatus Micrarchaeota archaeon]|nr:MarC family protein [Candidatus Micrarchaeota archaeon]